MNTLKFVVPLQPLLRFHVLNEGLRFNYRFYSLKNLGRRINFFERNLAFNNRDSLFSRLLDPNFTFFGV